MNVKKITIDVGLEKPVKLLLTGDNHMSYADGREGSVEQRHSIMRNIQYFSCGMGEDNLKNRFAETVKYAKENCDLLVMAGDVIDHPAKLNLEILKSELQGVRYIYAIGNHDYNNYSVESESTALLHERENLIAGAVGMKPYNNSVQVGGLNIVSLEDTLYNFDRDAVEFVRSELERGLPILLLFHVPLYAESLESAVVSYWGSPIMTAAPAGAYTKYGRTPREISPETMEICRLIEREPLIKGVLAGHIHFDREDMIFGNKPQIVCEAGYLGSATEITVK